MSAKKYKKGDKVKIINNICGHGFRIGTHVVLNTDGKKRGYYQATGLVRGSNMTWAVMDEEVRSR